MKKEKILNSYRNERSDEGNDHINNMSDEKGFFAMLMLIMLITIYKIYMDLPFGDTGAIPLSFLSFHSFNRYKQTKENDALVYGIVAGLIGIVFLVWYVIETI
ncbi:DUF6442 family protein [Marinilactibacillus psychrotolerans]|uniref:DUF6442 family protein n=1 Tax=Marinilactibacillus psychrotolerans TaxID=191770 RepID=UPI0038886C25